MHVLGQALLQLRSNWVRKVSVRLYALKRVVYLCIFPKRKVVGQGPKFSRKDTHPAGRESFKRYSFCFDFHSSIFQSTRTERVSKQRFLPSNFGRLLEFTVWYKFRWYKMKFYLLDSSGNIVGLPVMSGKFDGGSINKHHNTGPTDQQNLAVSLT